MKDLKSENLYYYIYFGICSFIPLIAAIVSNSKILTRLLSVRGFFSAETADNIHKYQAFLIVLGLALLFTTVIAYKLKLLEKIGNYPKNIIFAIYIPLILLIMFEVGGRLVIGLTVNNHNLYEDHPYLITTLKPNAKFEKISINSMGYRGNEFKLAKGGNVFRIVCLGGSATFCGNVFDDETWCQQLEDILNKKTKKNPRVEVVNAGVPGYTTSESLINLNLRILDINPDIIIIYLSYNDFKPNRMPDFKSDYSHWRHNFGKVEEHPNKEWFVTPKAIRVIKTKLFPKYDLGFKRYDTVGKPGLAAYKRNIENIVTVAKSRDIGVVLSSEASMLSEETIHSNSQAFQRAMRYVLTLSKAGLLDAQKKYDLIMKDISEKFNITYVDNLETVPMDFDHFIDNIHLNKKGCRVVAENFANAIQKSFLSSEEDSESSPKINSLYLDSYTAPF